MQITNLDVGQGDCAFLRYEDMTILEDGGSSDVAEVGKYRNAAFVKYYGSQKIDYIFLTHSDSDHTSGIIEILEDERCMDFKIGTVVLPHMDKEDENFSAIENLCNSRGVQVKRMNAGDEIHVSNVKIACIHPAKNYDWQSENGYSLVLEVSYGDFNGLFTGDLESSGEEAR